MKFKSIQQAILSALVFLSLTSCNTSESEYSPFLRAEPAVNAVLNQAPRTLRLFFTALPNVEASSLTLTGPGGELDLRGFHTMGSDDLMIEINEELDDGNYRVDWITEVEGDPQTYQGFYNFTVDSQL